MRRRHYLTAITTTAVSLAVAGCSEGSEEFEGGNGGNGDGSSETVELLSHALVRENEGSAAETVAVEGEAENVSDEELSYAEVEVKFYEGETLSESSLDNINGWSAGERWAFEVQFPGIGEDAAAITDYRIRAGTSL